MGLSSSPTNQQPKEGEPKNKVGRPRKPTGLQEYQHMAVYPSTHARIKVNAREKGLSIVDYLDKVIK